MVIVRSRPLARSTRECLSGAEAKMPHQPENGAEAIMPHQPWIGPPLLPLAHMGQPPTLGTSASIRKANQKIQMSLCGLRSTTLLPRVCDTSCSFNEQSRLFGRVGGIGLTPNRWPGLTPSCARPSHTPCHCTGLTPGTASGRHLGSSSRLALRVEHCW